MKEVDKSFFLPPPMSITLLMTVVMVLNGYSTLSEATIQEKCRQHDIKWDENKASCEVPKSCIDIVMPNKKLGTSGAVAIAKALDMHPRVERIFMPQNNLGPRAAVELVKILEDLERVSVVHMERNSIGDEGAEAFATLLSSNHPLKELNLNDNDIGNVGARALVEAIRYNTNLETLYYFQNDEVRTPIHMAFPWPLYNMPFCILLIFLPCVPMHQMSDALKEELGKVVSEEKLKARRKRRDKDEQAALSAEEIISQAMAKYAKAEEKEKQIREQLEEAAHMNSVATVAAKDAVAAKNKFLMEVQQCSQRTANLTSQVEKAAEEKVAAELQLEVSQAAQKRVTKQRDVAVAVLVCAVAFILKKVATGSWW